MVKGRDDDVTWPVRGFNGYCPGNISKAEHLEKYASKLTERKTIVVLSFLKSFA